MKIISYQVIRVQKFTKNSLGKIGAETERTSRNNRNADIDAERTPLNLYFKKSTNGMNAEWKSIVEKTNATFKDTKNSGAFEGKERIPFYSLFHIADEFTCGNPAADFQSGKL